MQKTLQDGLRAWQRMWEPEKKSERRNLTRRNLKSPESALVSAFLAEAALQVISLGALAKGRRLGHLRFLGL